MLAYMHLADEAFRATKLALNGMHVRMQISRPKPLTCLSQLCNVLGFQRVQDTNTYVRI